MGCSNSKTQQSKDINNRQKQNGLQIKIDDRERKDSTIFKAQTPTNRKYEAPNKKEEGETASRDNLKEYYKLGKIQGIGSFGQVRIATSIQEDSRTFAIKTIAKGRMGEKAYMLRRELEILKTLDHPNVIKFYEIFHDEEFIYFVMEYCNGGDLYNQITGNKKYFTEKEAANVLFKVFCALAHMHSKDVIHRDLKPENLLFASKDEDSELKIIDFGLSRIFQPNKLKDVPSVVGTPLYVAPEVIEETYYGKQCDNWSLGVVTYYILCGKEPFYGQNIGEVYKKIRTAEFSFQGDPWPTISEEAKDLISKLLVVDPKQRMSAKDALKHPWFKKMVKHNEPTKIELSKHQFFIQNILENHAFKQVFKLKKEVIKILINHYLTNKEIQILQKTFRLIDLDNNGELSFSEMKHVMEIIGYGIEEIQNMRLAFVQIRQTNQYQSKKEDIQKQSDEDLVIYESEFMRAALNLKKYLTKDNLEGLFKFFAKSEEDKIILQDIKDVIAREGRKLQEQELEDMMAEVSMEKRGSISFDLFKLMMQEDDIAKVQLSSIKMQKLKTATKKSLFKH